MVRCVFTIPKKKQHWMLTNIFHTYTKTGDGSNKVIIDDDICMNVVPKGIVTRMNLRPEPYPHPYEVAWVDNLYMFVSERCLASLMLSANQHQKELMHELRQEKVVYA
ncbi:hypothetical protein CFOL_v3_29363 [Cephalotus follicularis]|uniref:Uncharacterized protein n=1 Tax=Cephalotus follicularis TaxID=3775 RepID=A0A1Q3D0B8_CEPFO|nr:hypothetical protein CFOL_v3_29363 [Cephalotus follicularis]